MGGGSCIVPCSGRSSFGGVRLVGAGVLDWVWPPALLALVVWMVVRARRQLRSRSGRWLLYPVFALMAVAAIGGGYETVAEALDEDPPMPGQLIDVGGHSLHLRCSGSGSPTVVLDPGAGLMSSVLGGSPRPSPERPASAFTTAQVTAGASSLTAPRTARR